MGLEKKVTILTKTFKKKRNDSKREKRTKRISEVVINKLFKNLELKSLEFKHKEKKIDIKNILESIFDYLPKKKEKIKETVYQKNDTIYGEPSSSYVDYDKLYSYLGKFKSQSMYENFVSPLEIDKEKDKTVEIPLEMEKIDSAIRHFKYFIPGDLMADPALPPLGMSSEEYEKFKIWKQINYVEYWLKTKII